MSRPFDPKPPEYIDGVVARFDAVLDWARQQENRLGYFAALYRGVTLRIRSALSTDTFDNPDASERLAIVFAGRYFEALAGHSEGTAITRAWQVTFDAAGQWPPTVMQHLLLGINAHICLDLGIAAARTMTDARLSRADFERVNDILLKMIDQVQTTLAGVWPLLRLLDWQAGRLDEALIGASLLQARARAWEFAQALRVAGADQTALIARRDQRVAKVARHIAAPKPLLGLALGTVRLGELRSVVDIIDLLDTQTTHAAEAVG